MPDDQQNGARLEDEDLSAVDGGGLVSEFDAPCSSDRDPLAG